MQSKDSFSGYHPIVNFVYFGLTIGFSMFFMHPVCLLISLVCSASYCIKLNGMKSAEIMLKFCLPLMLITALINPAFNHQGKNILCYLPTGNPLTAESIIYGIAAAIMLVSVLLWFSCYTSVMTSDKFVYLFGRVIPSLSLVLSMTLRFVPRFKAQFANVKQAQAGVGRDISNGPVLVRMKNAISCFSIMVTWSLENSIETADSMKSRGYGFKDRTAFSIYRFTDRDKAALLWMILCGLFVFSSGLSGSMFWRYFPSIRGNLTAPITVSSQVAYFALCITPIVIDVREEKQWKSLQ